MTATSAAYNFWLYELCDVYIVSVLAAFIIQPGVSEDSGVYRKR